MKRYIKHIILFFSVILAVSCSESFLDYTPKGKLGGDMLNAPEHLDKLVTAAYASLGNDDWDPSISHMWIWGSVRSDDAFKGGGSVGDQGEMDFMEQFVTIRTDLGKPNRFWTNVYEGIGRANDALARIDLATEADYPQKIEREAELRFLRGHWYFLLKILFKNPVWIDETVAKEEIKNIPNLVYTSDEFWDKIAEDFEFAANNLPLLQDEVGRASQTAAWAYLAKVRLYQAYEQNDKHEVVNINEDRLQQVITLTDYVINSGKHSLSPDFADNFLVETKNGPESIFAIQFSVDDGTPTGRIFKAAGLNYNMAPEYGCCDFHNPSQNMVNAFRTDEDGLPLHDTFNEVTLRNPEDFWNNSIDPRFDHTIGVAGHPFKYVPDWIYQPNWRRAPHVYGYYSTMKEVVAKGDPTFRKYGAFIGTALNSDILRYDDVLLWKAEALIELDREAEALPIINQIRERAANSTGKLVYANGDPVSNYKIEPYIDGVNCTWTKEYARKALQFERRLEFAMESPRFFDLVRWGIAAETLNDYFEVEKERFAFLKDAHFEKNRDEYLPIPQAQINLVDGIYIQNNGW
jgi:hypothetical protein